MSASPFGDSCSYVAKTLINPEVLKVTHDSLYNASAEFQVSDFTTLQMLGIVTSKNHLVIGMIYPRFNYLFSPKTQFTGGFSIGSVRRFLLGWSHIYSPSLTLGIQSQVCAHQWRKQDSLSIKHRLSDTVTANTSIMASS